MLRRKSKRRTRLRYGGYAPARDASSDPAGVVDTRGHLVDLYDCLEIGDPLELAEKVAVLESRGVLNGLLSLVLFLPPDWPECIVSITV